MPSYVVEKNSPDEDFNRPKYLIPELVRYEYGEHSGSAHEPADVAIRMADQLLDIML